MYDVALGGQREAELLGVFEHRPVREGRLEGVGLRDADGEMEDVVNDEHTDDDAGLLHVAGSHRGAQPLGHPVLLGAAGLGIFNAQGDRRPDVDHHAGKHHKPEAPEARPEGLQEMGIPIDMIWLQENL